MVIRELWVDCSISSVRLISEKTIEENILKKANQKKLLGDLAIEGGNFTTAYFKSVSIAERASHMFELLVR